MTTEFIDIIGQQEQSFETANTVSQNGLTVGPEFIRVIFPVQQIQIHPLFTAALTAR